MFNKICIIGVGLIGGSIARAAREKGLAGAIVGCGRKSGLQNLQKAKQLGVIDEYYFDIEPAVHNADLVVIATPVGVVEKMFSSLKDYWSDSAVYTDVGSTKGSVIEAAARVFGGVPANFVPAHPIAGAEKTGVEAARPDLFQNKRLIITPLPQTDIKALEKIEIFWKFIGASVSSMDVSHHDHVLAATSHLPHVLAYSLVDMLGRKDEKKEILRYAAGGFKDFTRIASSDPTMWLDICMANRNEIIPLIDQLKDELELMAKMLKDGESEKLFKTFSDAKRARQRFLDLYE